MPTVALICHPVRKEAHAAALKVIDSATELGSVRIVLDEHSATALDRSDLSCGSNEIGPDVKADVAVAVGGDGTVLKAVGCLGVRNVPIIAINAGQLGYLADHSPSDAGGVLGRWLAGELIERPRMMLEVAVPGAEKPSQVFGLNELVVHRSGSGRLIHLETEINGEQFMTYSADGMIVATPTGSTAYAMAVGGPIIDPGFRALLLTPVAAHMPFARPLVLTPQSVVRLSLEQRGPAEVSVDGRWVGELTTADAVTVAASDSDVTFLRSSVRNFHGLLKDKFRIGG